MALDFLARTFRLDQLPKLLRAGLQALRQPVDKGIDWVITGILKVAKAAWQGIKAGGKAVGQAGKKAVGAVKGWLGFRQEFTLPDTKEHYSVLLAKGTGRLLLTSVPHL